MTFLMTFITRHPWTTAFLIWGLADTITALKGSGNESHPEDKLTVKIEKKDGENK